MKQKTIATVLTLTLSLSAFTAQAEDARPRVKMPAPMVTHMLGNMRDHLQAINEIQSALANNELDKAADIAEQRIGMSSLEAHHAAMMAPYMPKAMQDIGTEMHHAASRFALAAKEGDMKKSLGELSKVTQQCVACHAGYRVH
jgi:cytochrome c556